MLFLFKRIDTLNNDLIILLSPIHIFFKYYYLNLYYIDIAVFTTVENVAHLWSSMMLFTLMEDHRLLCLQSCCIVVKETVSYCYHCPAAFLYRAYATDMVHLSGMLFWLVDVLLKI